jgi:hypothetical protein
MARSASFLMADGDVCADTASEVEVTSDDRSRPIAVEPGRSAADCEWFEQTVLELLSDLFGTALRLTPQPGGRGRSRRRYHRPRLEPPGRAGRQDPAARLAVPDPDQFVRGKTGND